MDHRLYIIEGLPCSGKSTTSALVAELLKQQGNVCFVDEGTGEHPADYEFHALAPAGMHSEETQIVSLKDYSGELFDRLLQYKIYDFLPWETEMPLMLEKWRQFVREAKDDTIYVFNCDSVRKAAAERPGWLDGVIDYHVQGAYGKSIGAEGFEGYIQCLIERQERELRVLSTLPVEIFVLENPQRDWKAAHEQLVDTINFTIM